MKTPHLRLISVRQFARTICPLSTQSRRSSCWHGTMSTSGTSADDTVPIIIKVLQPHSKYVSICSLLALRPPRPWRCIQTLIPVEGRVKLEREHHFIKSPQRESSCHTAQPGITVKGSIRTQPDMQAVASMNLAWSQILLKANSMAQCRRRYIICSPSLSHPC